MDVSNSVSILRVVSYVRVAKVTRSTAIPGLAQVSDIIGILVEKIQFRQSSSLFM